MRLCVFACQKAIADKVRCESSNENAPIMKRMHVANNAMPALRKYSRWDVGAMYPSLDALISPGVDAERITGDAFCTHTHFATSASAARAAHTPLTMITMWIKMKIA